MKSTHNKGNNESSFDLFCVTHTRCRLLFLSLLDSRKRGSHRWFHFLVWWPTALSITTHKTHTSSHCHSRHTTYYFCLLPPSFRQTTPNYATRPHNTITAISLELLGLVLLEILVR